MNRYPARTLMLVAWLGLYGAQLSGLHMHVDGHGYSGAPHAAHSHTGGKDPHDHEHDTDVNIVDLGIVSKYLLFLIAIPLSIVMLVGVIRRLVPSRAQVLPLRPRLRWRPPLRAPPASLYSTP